MVQLINFSVHSAHLTDTSIDSFTQRLMTLEISCDLVVDSHEETKATARWDQMSQISKRDSF